MASCSTRGVLDVSTYWTTGATPPAAITTSTLALGSCRLAIHRMAFVAPTKLLFVDWRREKWLMKKLVTDRASRSSRCGASLKTSLLSVNAMKTSESAVLSPCDAR